MTPTIRYQDNLENITPRMLEGFFVGWIDSPTPQTHYNILMNSDEIVLAIDDEAGRVVGFVNAISDRLLMAYLPLLEVLPDYQNQGIAHTMMEHILAQFQHFYGIDLICDPELIPFYEKFGMRAMTGMVIRNYDRQAGIIKQTGLDFI